MPQCVLRNRFLNEVHASRDEQLMGHILHASRYAFFYEAYLFDEARASSRGLELSTQKGERIIKSTSKNEANCLIFSLPI